MWFVTTKIFFILMSFDFSSHFYRYISVISLSSVWIRKKITIFVTYDLTHFGHFKYMADVIFYLSKIDPSDAGTPCIDLNANRSTQIMDRKYIFAVIQILRCMCASVVNHCGSDLTENSMIWRKQQSLSQPLLIELLRLTKFTFKSSSRTMFRNIGIFSRTRHKWLLLI